MNVRSDIPPPAGTSSQQYPQARRPRRKSASGQQAGLAAIIVLLLVLSEIDNRTTFHLANLIAVLGATSIYFIGACGATLLLVGGGLDLSIGAVFAAGGIAAGLLMKHGIPWPIAIILALAVAAAFGGVNALLIVFGKVPPFITTLGMYFAATGLVTVVTGGVAIPGFPSGFDNLGQLDLFRVPLLVYYAVALGVAFYVLLSRTRFGYDVRTVGGNAAAALANGVRVKRVNVSLYIISAATAGLCGILFAASVGAADPASGGTDFTFLVLAAVIIGGTSLFGGIGSIPGTALGALLFSVINDVLALVHADPLWGNIVTGVILVGAVAFDQLRRSRRFRDDPR
jgi:ribose transport system permease protein